MSEVTESAIILEDAKVDGWLKENLVCPRDYSYLRFGDQMLACPLGHTYSCIDGIPIMLLEEAKPTHIEYSRSLDPALVSQTLNKFKDYTLPQGATDPYVQNVVSATCGAMYLSLMNKLTRYPIPELRLPQASGEYFLDIGCNWGRWCISAAQKGYNAVGIDPSFKAILSARRVAHQLGTRAHYVVADARYLPFTRSSFDVVFS